MFSIILIVIAAIAIVVGGLFFISVRNTRRQQNEHNNGKPSYDRVSVTFNWPPYLMLLGLAGLVAIFGFGSFYTQSPNEATVKVSWTGAVVGHSTDSGLHTKAPWEKIARFDIRNQQIGFGTTAQKGAVAFFPTKSINVTDADGIASSIQMNLQFSIDPAKVVDIYNQYKSEDNFINQFVISRMNTDVRDIPTKMHTLDLITGNTIVSQKSTTAAKDEFDGSGLIIDAVSIQDINYPKSISDKYEQAAQSAIEVQKAQNDLNATKISSQQQVVQAEAKAKANQELSASLTPQVLQQNYIDALTSSANNGGLIVVPNNGGQIINLPQAK